MIATCKTCFTRFDVIKTNSFFARHHFKTHEKTPFRIDFIVICPECGSRSKEMIFEGEKAEKLFFELVKG
ncbi:MAG: hypothetical protein NZ879_08610, partial [Archaeoglobaceae archaeon]|nr:hypothetical protein [Archaeoglobaceae archaeon]MDW8119025.1 hypothetical protein [Archaeoglobaceae archaeon]